MAADSRDETAVRNLDGVQNDADVPLGYFDFFAPAVSGDPKMRLVMPTAPQAPKVHHPDVDV